MRSALLSVLLLASCSQSTPTRPPVIDDIREARIMGGSVSSGFLVGKPAAEIIAERMGLSIDNRAYICNRLDPQESRGLRAGTLAVDIDGHYWQSYDRDCARAVNAVRAFYENATGLPKVVATVPDRNAGAFYRFVCNAESARQSCRAAINTEIRRGCTGRCVLIDADGIYSQHKDVPDIHLTPEIWRQVADQHFNAIVDKLRSP